jgi:hypothetical protein
MREIPDWCAGCTAAWQSWVKRFGSRGDRISK